MQAALYTIAAIMGFVGKNAVRLHARRGSNPLRTVMRTQSLLCRVEASFMQVPLLGTIASAVGS
jgi:hypothetical protein